MVFKEFKLQVFENKVLRKIFGLNRVEVSNLFSVLHNEGLHEYYGYC